MAEIYTYSIVRSAAEAFTSKVPYLLAVIEDRDKPKFLSIVEGYKDGDKVNIGAKVEFSHNDENNNPVYKLV